MKIPKKVRIAGHDYKIKWDDKKLSEGDFQVAEEASKHVLALPMYPELTKREQECVVSKINEFYEGVE